MKNELRMTMEELKSLKPSFGNPITLICDDGYFTANLSAIKVIGIDHMEDRVYMVKKDGDTYSVEKNYFNKHHVHHYPSLQQRKVKKTFYQMLCRLNKRDIWYFSTDLVDEEFKGTSGVEVGVGLERKLIKEYPIEIEIDL